MAIFFTQDNNIAIFSTDINWFIKFDCLLYYLKNIFPEISNVYIRHMDPLLTEYITMEAFYLCPSYGMQTAKFT